MKHFRSISLLYRISIIFLLGSIACSVWFTIYQGKKDNLIDNLNEHLNEHLNQHVEAEYSTTRRATALVDKVFNYIRYASDLDGLVAKDGMRNELIRNISYLLNNIKGLNKEYITHEHVTVPLNELAHLDTIRQGIDTHIDLLIGRNVDEFENILWNNSELTKVTGSNVDDFWKYSGEKLQQINVDQIIRISEQQLSQFNRLHIVFQSVNNHYKTIVDNIKLKLEEIYFSLIIGAILIFIGQIIVFLISSSFDLSDSIYELPKNIRKKMTYLLLATVLFCGVAFLADQIILQIENYSSHYQVKINDKNVSFDILSKSNKELRQTEMTLNNIISRVEGHVAAFPEKERAIKSNNWGLKGTMMVFPLLFTSISNHPFLTGDSIFEMEHYKALKVQFEKLNSMNEGNYLTFAYENTKAILYNITLVENAIASKIFSLKEEIYELREIIEDLSSWQSSIIVMSTIFQAVSLFLLILCYRNSFKISGRSTIGFKNNLAEL